MIHGTWSYICMYINTVGKVSCYTYINMILITQFLKSNIQTNYTDIASGSDPPAENCWCAPACKISINKLVMCVRIPKSLYSHKRNSALHWACALDARYMTNCRPETTTTKRKSVISRNAVVWMVWSGYVTGLGLYPKINCTMVNACNKLQHITTNLKPSILHVSKRRVFTAPNIPTVLDKEHSFPTAKKVNVNSSSRAPRLIKHET